MKTQTRIKSLSLTVLLLIFASISVAQNQRTIRILAIGNSFSVDAVENYLYELGEAAGVNLIIGNANIGGCSLERHRNNSVSGAADYQYMKIVNGTKTLKKKSTLEYCLTDEPWDYISFQQVSQNSGLYDTYYPFLTELAAYVKQKALNPKVTYMLHRTWAYAQNSTHKGFANYNNKQLTMYRAIVKTTNKVKKSTKDIAFIIPSGTAIQNARTSALGDNFCRDGFHLDLKIGRYVAACTWFEKITGINVVGNTATPEGLTAFEIAVAQNAAHFAVKKPDNVTSMKKFVLRPEKEIALQDMFVEAIND
ncbi:MAG: DUF4886 domain-containing protein [Prevotellaceae bacterium]|jgi:hypothetical protein|nr:DUF4886 domain-containing protein [Prevotellaceae bacterium]